MTAFAHTLEGKSQEHWEPLFTSFGQGENNCQRDTCQKCADLEPQHGNLNYTVVLGEVLGNYEAEKESAS